MKSVNSHQHSVSPCLMSARRRVSAASAATPVSPPTSAPDQDAVSQVAKRSPGRPKKRPAEQQDVNTPVAAAVSVSLTQAISSEAVIDAGSQVAKRSPGRPKKRPAEQQDANAPVAAAVVDSLTQATSAEAVIDAGSPARQPVKRRSKSASKSNLDPPTSVTDMLQPVESTSTTTTSTTTAEITPDPMESPSQPNKRRAKSASKSVQESTASTQPALPLSVGESLNAASTHIGRTLSHSYIPHTLFGVDSQRVELYEMLERTLKYGENNAALLMGTRGAGKSLVLRHVLRELQQAYVPRGISFVEVYLNGTIHSDDVCALREISRQLRLQNELEINDDGLSAAVAVSHTAGANFFQNMEFLREMLRQTKKIRQPVFFILDEFDCFVQQPKQTLLYNLFDMVQDPESQMTVVALSSRLDDFDSLEKRIKSRSSFRRLYFPSLGDVAALKSILLQAICLPDSFVSTLFRDQWNSAVKLLLEDTSVSKFLTHHVQLAQPVRWFFNIFFCYLSGLSASDPVPVPSGLLRAAATHCADFLLESVRNLPIVELTMLVAMTQLERRTIVTYNFAIAYDEYARSRKSLDSSDLYSPAVCLKAFQSLADSNLITYMSTAPGSAEFRPVRLALDGAEILSVLSQMSTCPSWLQQWAAHWVE